MIKDLFLLVGCIGVLFFSAPAPVKAHPHILDANDKVEITPDRLLEDLRKTRVVFIGEFHDHPGHHRMQRDIIDALDDADTPLAIGLEMFRKDSQAVLDEWVSQDISLHEFLIVYNDNWSMWPLYRDIFIHARNRNIKMLGLNIPRSISGMVAQNGFESLPKEQRQMLGEVQCIVDPQYGQFIRQAYGGHGGHGEKFLYFCEAQLLWDTMMARNLVNFLRENPDYRVIVLAGSGHAWKYGIPKQMMEEAEIDYRVILPEIVGRADRSNISPEIADYLWLDSGAGSWTLPESID